MYLREERVWEEDEVREDEAVVEVEVEAVGEVEDVGEVDHREEEKKIKFGELEVFLHVTFMFSQLEEVSSKQLMVEELNSQLEAVRMEKRETGVTRWRGRQDEQESCSWQPQPPWTSHQECC